MTSLTELVTLKFYFFFLFFDSVHWCGKSFNIILELVTRDFQKNKISDLLTRKNENNIISELLTLNNK